MFWLKWSSFYFNVLLFALAIAGPAGFFLLKKWRRRIRYRNLYHKLLNQPPAEQAGVQYPPPAAGIELKSLEEILAPHMELIKNTDMATETADVFEKRYWPAIERYARTVHLLPASAEHHHFAPGGLLHHGLQVGYYTMLQGRDGLYGTKLGDKKRDARERYLFACFMAGLCHDLGKIVSDMRVSTGPGGLAWSPHTAGLLDWAVENSVPKYYVDWESGRHKVHETMTHTMLSKVLTEEDRKYLVEIDQRLLPEMMLALTPYSGPTAPSMQPYKFREMVQKADSRSVEEDQKTSRSLADLGVETRTPLARHYTEGMQQLFKEGKWQINQSNGAAWVLGPARDLYLAWPRCGLELYDYLAGQGIQGVPNAPEVIAETLARWEVIVPGSDNDYYWRIRPGGQDGPPLDTVRLRTDWARQMAGVLPPGLAGSVECSAEGALSWTRVEASPETEAVMDNPVNNPVLEPAPANPGVEAPRASVALSRDGMAAPASSIQPEASREPAGRTGWLRILKHWAFGMFLGSMVVVAFLIHLYQQVEPEAPYWLAFWMMLDNAFDHGYFVMGLILSVVLITGLKVYSTSLMELKEAKKKSAEMEAEAQGFLARAKQESDETVARARSEAGELIKTAKGEAADIRIKAREEAAAEAEKMMEQAKKRAQETMDDFWLILQAKAKDMGIADEELQGLVKVLQKAKEEAAAIKAQAEAKAQEAAEEIILKAREDAGKITRQAQENAEEIINEAQAKSKEILRKARVEAADILLSRKEPEQDGQTPAGPQSQEDSHGQEDLAEEEAAAEEDTDDLGDLADQVAALEGKILGILSGEKEMKKRDLERKAAKSYYGRLWQLAIGSLLTEGKVIYNPDSKTYRCQS